MTRLPKCLPVILLIRTTILIWASSRNQECGTEPIFETYLSWWLTDGSRTFRRHGAFFQLAAGRGCSCGSVNPVPVPSLGFVQQWVVLARCAAVARGVFLQGQSAVPKEELDRAWNLGLFSDQRGASNHPNRLTPFPPLGHKLLGGVKKEQVFCSGDTWLLAGAESWPLPGRVLKPTLKTCSAP